MSNTRIQPGVLTTVVTPAVADWIRAGAEAANSNVSRYLRTLLTGLYEDAPAGEPR